MYLEIELPLRPQEYFLPSKIPPFRLRYAILIGLVTSLLFAVGISITGIGQTLLLFTALLGIVLLITWCTQTSALASASNQTSLQDLKNELAELRDSISDLSSGKELRHSRREIVSLLNGLTNETRNGQAHFEREISRLERSQINAARSAEAQERKRELSLDAENPLSIFSPSLIAAGEIKAKPSAHSAGRLAADQDMLEDGSSKLVRLLNSCPTNNVRKTQLVGSRTLYDPLSHTAQVDYLMPGLIPETPARDLTYLVIDTRPHHAGPWRGMEETPFTIEFQALSDYVKKCASQGTVIISVLGDSPSHLSSSYADLAHIRVQNGRTDLKWELENNLPVLEILANATKE